MRAIKFRCWSGERMISPDYVDRDGVAHWKENSIPESSTNVMLWTGLKDKHGVEIYEGDIIEKMSWIGWCDKCCSFELFFVGFGCAGCEDGEKWWETVEAKGKLEVLGNIYENPELLES